MVSLCLGIGESGYLLGIFTVVTSSHSEFLPFILIMLPLGIYLCLSVGTYHEKTSISTLALSDNSKQRRYQLLSTFKVTPAGMGYGDEWGKGRRKVPQTVLIL